MLVSAYSSSLSRPRAKLLKSGHKEKIKLASLEATLVQNFDPPSQWHLKDPWLTFLYPKDLWLKFLYLKTDEHSCFKLINIVLTSSFFAWPQACVSGLVLCGICIVFSLYFDILAPLVQYAYYIDNLHLYLWYLYIILTEFVCIKMIWICIVFEQYLYSTCMSAVLRIWPCLEGNLLLIKILRTLATHKTLRDTM